jgi:hypothetical protein
MEHFPTIVIIFLALFFILAYSVFTSTQQIASAVSPFSTPECREQHPEMSSRDEQSEVL